MAGLAAEFGPCAALGHTGVDGFFDDGGADAACGFHFFALVVVTIGDDGFGTVFVGGDLLRGKRGRLVEIFVISPVRAARMMEASVEFVRLREASSLPSEFGHDGKEIARGFNGEKIWSCW